MKPSAVPPTPTDWRPDVGGLVRGPDVAETRYDPLAWWEDKQVAITVNGAVVRGWVLRARSAVGRLGPAGSMTVVLLTDRAGRGQPYPAEVTVAVHGDRPHGRPDGVIGLWPETDHSDVQTATTPQRGTPVAAPAQPARR